MFFVVFRLMANLTQPYDMCIQPSGRISETYSNEVNNLINSAKHQCTDLDFLKALSANMKQILRKVRFTFFSFGKDTGKLEIKLIVSIIVDLVDCLSPSVFWRDIGFST